jgi:hypothetical protein
METQAGEVQSRTGSPYAKAASCRSVASFACVVPRAGAFRAVLDSAKQHAASPWIEGMADIHKYQTERNAAKLALLKSDAKHLSFRLTCTTDPADYDQLLTIELAPPSGWGSNKIRIKGTTGPVIKTCTRNEEGASTPRFDVSPRDAEFVIEASADTCPENDPFHEADDYPRLPRPVPQHERR